MCKPLSVISEKNVVAKNLPVPDLGMVGIVYTINDSGQYPRMINSTILLHSP
jgi:hypothetical protein